jgi:hypothetical protein
VNNLFDYGESNDIEKKETEQKAGKIKMRQYHTSVTGLRISRI